MATHSASAPGRITGRGTTNACGLPAERASATRTSSWLARRGKKAVHPAEQRQGARRVGPKGLERTPRVTNDFAVQPVAHAISDAALEALPWSVAARGAIAGHCRRARSL